MLLHAIGIIVSVYLDYLPRCLLLQNGARWACKVCVEIEYEHRTIISIAIIFAPSAHPNLNFSGRILGAIV